MTSPSLREKVWGGKVPILVTISEPAALGSHVYLLYASRISYLPIYTVRLISYFGRYLEESSKSAKENDWWFEFNGLPLPWNRPVGVLYDILVGLPTGAPWPIELKTGAYPGDKILSLESEDTLLSYWTNQFKESCYIRDGNARAVMLMPREQQEALWKAVLDSANSDSNSTGLKIFWTYADPLVRKPGVDWNVPLRVYPKALEQPMVQPIVRGSETLGDVLRRQLPGQFPDTDDPNLNSAQAVIHGVVLPLDVELSSLYSELMYMDGFLHISINNRA